jgi:hypothetical protein
LLLQEVILGASEALAGNINAVISTNNIKYFIFITIENTIRFL